MESSLSSPSSSDDERRPAPAKPPPKPPAAQAPDAKRGRGRPPTTGEYVGLAAAKQKLVEAERAQLELDLEREVAERTTAMVTARATRPRAGPAPADPDPPAAREQEEARAALAGGLQRQIAESLAVVANVAKVSKGLKGTLQKALKEAAASIQEATDELLSRTDSEEVALLRAANGRMEAEIADLRRELRSLRDEVTRPRANSAPPPPPPPEMETNMAANLERMTLLMENRFAAIEEQMRSVRPAPSPARTLSPAPRARPTPPPTSPIPGPSVEEYPPLPQRGRKKRAVAMSTPPPPPCPAPTTSSAAAEDGWTTVSRKKAPRKAAQPSSGTQPAATAADAQTTRARRQRGRGRGRKEKGDVAQAPASQPPPPPPPPPKKENRARGRKVPRMRPPKSSAVVLTMQSGAEERGVTYASLLSRAKANIRLADLGIEGGLRLKRARTGARMLVVPGATSAPQADALAESLRTVLNAEDVRVSRPEKAVYVRVSGLDDTTEGDDVAAAIARTTGCSRESAPPWPGPTKGPGPQKAGGEGPGSQSAPAVMRMLLRLPDMVFEDSSGVLASTHRRGRREERPAPKPPPKPKAAAKAPDAKRGRGRPPTTGEYVGLADAKKALVEAQRAEMELQCEKDIVEKARLMATARVTRSKTGGTLAGQAPPESRTEHAEGLQRQIADSLAVVAGVAKVSKGLKGTLQKALKEAVPSVQEAPDELLGRTDTEEVALLRAANRRMEAELADLRRELASIRSELAEARAGSVRSAPPHPRQSPHHRRRRPQTWTV
ncbi:hypothetical protein K1T71_004225 [Dendrolimus kikuchii]|uniref:Uncharacterized protein n=1 Tax=Dendrolimus kikuchii TaxID=765133 RepID=A0ACC1DA89_9NEOP|nr:hypothetical protein K1T71_004225 [Dendrolimus kikuchii]